jgi:hypothetical protein
MRTPISVGNIYRKSAMTTTSRIAIVLAVVGVLVAGFFVLRTADKSSTQTSAPVVSQPHAQASNSKQSVAQPTDQPRNAVIRLRNGKPVGGIAKISVRKDQTVRLQIKTDSDVEIHLHGYDITKNALPAQPALFVFKAKLEGVFEIEIHSHDQELSEPLIAKLAVTRGD